jgi:KUP system potassium uptake protein
MLVWFALLAVLGAAHIAQEPGILSAINPTYAIDLFYTNGWHGFVILGTVFLVVTGGEALYADIGHFGTFPIRFSWFTLVFPALILNYFGQGCLLLHGSQAATNPFYYMAPTWALYPVIGLATLAAVIASQAVITGSFSLTLQAIQFGFCPRLRIQHTSSEQFGQIYIPAVNRALMLLCVALVLGFRSSSKLAAAYGLAITMTMATTTLIFSLLVLRKWKWNPLLAIAFAAVFLGIDLSFFGATSLKMFHGGWFPLTFAGIIYLLMGTWRDGRRLLAKRLQALHRSNKSFVEDLIADPPARVPGTAVFLTGHTQRTPLALRRNILHNRVLHERNIILAVETADIPHIPAGERLKTEMIGENFYRAALTYGFMDEPDIPRDLMPASSAGPWKDWRPVSYFLARATLLPTSRPGMYMWRETLYAFMSRNAQPATLFFHLPVEEVIEIGLEVEL